MTTTLKVLIGALIVLMLASLLALIIALFPVSQASASTACLYNNDGTLAGCVTAPKEVSKGDSIEVAEASSHAPCGILHKAKGGFHTDGVTGRIRTTHFSLGFCTAHNHITWHGNLNIWGDIGRLGVAAAMHWDGQDITNSNWFVGSGANADGGFAQTGNGRYAICSVGLPPFGGKICATVAVDWGKMLVYGDGSWKFYWRGLN